MAQPVSAQMKHSCSQAAQAYIVKLAKRRHMYYKTLYWEFTRFVTFRSDTSFIIVPLIGRIR